MMYRGVLFGLLLAFTLVLAGGCGGGSEGEPQQVKDKFFGRDKDKKSDKTMKPK